jgi:DNA-binding response OmpR family regulator
MKKVIIVEALRPYLEKEKSFLHRADIKTFTVATNDELWAVHKAENANLIITQTDMAGMASEKLFAAIRGDNVLRKVSLIVVCADRPGDRERAQQCNPNVIFTVPLNTGELLEKVQHLLDIPWRESYRVLLSVNIEGNSRDKAFFCRSENISTTGLLLETDKSLKEGDRLICSFFLPESKQITATGEIVRAMIQSEKSNAKKYGVRFDKLLPDAKSAIEVFVTKKAQMTRPRSV